MLTPDIQSILYSIPHQSPWPDIVQFEKLDDRVAIANNLCANIIGINENTIEGCPNDEPPNHLETLARVVGCPSRFRSGYRQRSSSRTQTDYQSVYFAKLTKIKDETT
jgi:hypothetical protein